MPSLRTLLTDLEPPSLGNPRQIFYVMNTSNSVRNGGCCCLWTVPAGVTSVTFELWGAGGDGTGARCCEWGGYGPNSGNYAIKTVDTVEGCEFRICAASSGCDWRVDGLCCGISTRGFPSYVYDVTAAANIACACGGDGGNQEITRTSSSWGYTCCWARLDDCGFGDFSTAGTGTVYFKNQYCHNGSHYQIYSGGFGSGRKTWAPCATTWYQNGDDLAASCPSFPAGAGSSGRACGDSRNRGQHGAAGMVKISYN